MVSIRGVSTLACVGSWSTQLPEKSGFSCAVTTGTRGVRSNSHKAERIRCFTGYPGLDIEVCRLAEQLELTLEPSRGWVDVHGSTACRTRRLSKRVSRPALPATETTGATILVHARANSC